MRSKRQKEVEMRKILVSRMLVLVLLFSVVAAACAAPKPTPTVRPTATPAPAPTVGPTATPGPTPTVGPMATPGPTPTVAPTAIPTSAPTVAPGKVYEWVYASPTALSVLPELFLAVKKIEEISGGRIQIKGLGQGEHPYSTGDFLTAVRDGLIDLAYDPPTYIGNRGPETQVILLPFLTLGASYEEQAWLWDQLYDDIWGPVENKYNQILLIREITVAPSISARALATSFETAKGMTIRTSGKAQADVVAAMGFVPEVLAWAEVYTALQRKIIDGVYLTPGAVLQAGFYEIIKYITRVPGGMVLQNTIQLNKDRFNELPSDLQQKVRGAFDELSRFASESYAREDSKALATAVDEYGVAVGRMPQPMIDEIQKRVKPMWDAWAKSVGPKGPEILQKIQTLRQEWARTHK